MCARDKAVEELMDKLSEIEKDNKSLKRRVDNLEEREVQLFEENARLRQMLTSLMDGSNGVKDQMTQLHDLAEANGNCDLRTEVRDLTQRVNSVDELLLRDLQCTNHVQLGLSQPFVLRERMCLDICVKKVISNSFDDSSCCLIAPIDGTYALNVVFRQFGDGRLRVFANGNGLDLYLGKTSSRSDISSTMRVWKLKQGQKVYFQIMLDEGDATIRWCHLYTWSF